MSEILYKLVYADSGEPALGGRTFHAGQVLTCAETFNNEMLEWVLSILREHGAIVIVEANLSGYSLVDELLKALQAKGKT